MHGVLNLKVTAEGTLVREKQHHRIDECKGGEAQVGGGGNDAGAESLELAVTTSLAAAAAAHCEGCADYRRVFATLGHQRVHIRGTRDALASTALLLQHHIE